LKGFKRVSLQAGESKTVTLTLDTKGLGFRSSSMGQFAIEPGTFDVWVGDSSTAKDHHVTFEVTK
jgi:beta-glucosidase